MKQKWKGRQILAVIQIIPKMLYVCAGSIPTHWQLNELGEGGGGGAAGLHFCRKKKNLDFKMETGNAEVSTHTSSV